MVRTDPEWRFFFSTTLYLALLLTSFHNHIHTMGIIFRLLPVVPPLGAPDPAVSLDAQQAQLRGVSGLGRLQMALRTQMRLLDRS